MDQALSPDERHGDATPLFGAGRRGYDPDQVDRYVAEQQRRLDETTLRASEAERKLAAAVGQLRELHRRVAVLESEDRSPQPAPLDTLGERVQRILEEAWEGAYAVRQAAEQEVAELREKTAGEAESIIMAARQRARAVEEEIARRRTAYLEQVEIDRTRAVEQITRLHHERDEAVGELMKVKGVIEKTVSEIGSVAREPSAAGLTPSGLPSPVPARSAQAGKPAPIKDAPQRPAREPEPPEERPVPTLSPSASRPSASRPSARSGEADSGDGLPPTLAVHQLLASDPPAPVPHASELVRNIRAERSAAATASRITERLADEQGSAPERVIEPRRTGRNGGQRLPSERTPSERSRAARPVFDFDEE